jgi:quercetin dioxygenase-like cupin family protein
MNIYHMPDLALSAESADATRPATAIIHDSHDARIVLYRIERGQQVPVHTTSSTVLLVVISGRGVVAGAGGEHEVHVGDIVVYDVGEPHGMSAGREQLVIAAVLAPRPGDR